MNKTELFRLLVEQHDFRGEFLHLFPKTFSVDFLFDNDYVDSLYKETAALTVAAFGDLSEAVNWFIYEWQPGYKAYPNNDKEGIAINSFDEYIAYLKQYEGWED